MKICVSSACVRMHSNEYESESTRTVPSACLGMGRIPPPDHGQGNVAVDCARILLQDPAGPLRTTDIAQHALEALAKRCQPNSPHASAQCVRKGRGLENVMIAYVIAHLYRTAYETRDEFHMDVRRSAGGDGIRSPWIVRHVFRPDTRTLKAALCWMYRDMPLTQRAGIHVN